MIGQSSSFGSGYGPLGSGSDRRGQGAFGEELTDPAWQRWFDALRSQGIENIEFDPAASYAPIPGAPLPEPHESFMGRRGKIEDAGMEGIRRAARRRGEY